ncbi:hypothetical protein F7725_005224 [Dissostichus mawsoni]|uniref:IF rod domain-containing protein n=1 Tax=Dissostichus mawsoni TaxID=36200 RepID=A0A7J5YT47_DISMA|nr:hypothetical protein F7725_005224 [Dissostichus mawsoni]
MLIRAVVPDTGGLLSHPFPDLTLELRIGGLQSAHLLQVAAQAVVEVLHGLLLAATDAHTAAPAAPEGTSQVKTSAEPVGGVGHADTSTICTAVHAPRPPAGAGLHVGHGRAGKPTAKGGHDDFCSDSGDAAEAARRMHFIASFPEVGAAEQANGSLCAVSGPLLMTWDPVGEENVLTESLYRNVAKLWGVVHRLSNRPRDFYCLFTTLSLGGHVAIGWRSLSSPMDSMQDSSRTMGGLNARLKGFLEQVNRLQEANQQLEAQIADWGARSTPRSQDWTQQEQTVNELRAQVGNLLMENAQLALQSESMKSRAAAIQARCETEEITTLRLEQQVAVLRESKRKADQSSTTLQADLRHSMTDLQEMHREFEAAQALQLQRAGSCDLLLAAAAAGGEVEDGTAMELTQLHDRIRAQCDRGRSPSLGAGSNPLPGFAGPSHSGAAASRTHGGVLSEEEAAWAQVSLGGAALREARDELAEARRQWHSLQVEIETLHALEKGLESSLQNTQRLYSSQLQDLSQVIAGLESELEQVRSGLATQRQRHSQLLNTKMRLEREISTYRRLLEREEGRHMGQNGQPMGLRPWRFSMEEPKENGLENGFSDPAVTPDEPKSEPLPEIPSLLPAESGQKKTGLRSPGWPRCSGLRASVAVPHILPPSRQAAACVCALQLPCPPPERKIDKVIKQWEGSFFRGNPKLRRKSVSLRFDLHMAAANEGCAQTKQDSLPDVEVCLIMKRSRSIPTITQ